MTKYETMSASVLKHVSKRDYDHRKRAEGRIKFRRMTEQDCYGVQKKGVKNG